MDGSSTKIFYGKHKNGAEKYWQVYTSPTPEERTAKKMATSEKFEARLEVVVDTVDTVADAFKKMRMEV